MDVIDRLGEVLKTSFLALLLCILFGLTACGTLTPSTNAGPVMAVGVSDDGRYAISSHRDNRLILWSLEEESYREIADDANIYSAFFVPKRDAFLWQDLNDQVRVQSVDGEVLKTFDHFPTYGHAIDSTFEKYLSSDDRWNLFSGYGEDKKSVLKDGISPSFLGSGKLLNLSFSEERSLLVTAGSGGSVGDAHLYDPVDPDRRFSKFGGVTLWDTETWEPVARLGEHSFKTHATISPDGQWVVSVDENGIGFFWDTDEPENRQRLARDGLGVMREDSPYESGDDRNWDDSGLIPTPSSSSLTGSLIGVHFIGGSDYFLRFYNNGHHAALFKTGNPWPQKYFDLGESPELVTYGSQYSRNTAIATSPQAGVLVMGHRDSGGISVYEFDEASKTLERTWVAR